MNESRAAARYARAILDFAVEKKKTDVLENDMRAIVETIGGSKELREMLSSPVLKAEAKKKALLSVFKGCDSITEGLLNLLFQNRRINLLNEVALKYIILNEELKGEGVAFVTTAVPLSGELEKRVLKEVSKITGNKVVLKNKIDESIVGGFILRIGDLQYDASIANQLNTIKREFTKSV
ncbi:ATP synthase F1 subunit delta [Muriicola marianensis]|uniref:ATP synthase subunit delta n=1 Tax=Muriicola marianensis TaxID=1324801 RepID=A0ABQ1QYA7_9FLAO|nr:ATP synthase F1 subunit delta [Muriicola marianensis]GGD49585.1 ATP synthase subunit delta [Muriicola marianensis]